jgi:hypothetical protein
MPDVSDLPTIERRRFPRRWRRARRALVGILAIVGLALLGNLALTRLGGPQLFTVSPSPAHVGETVTLAGRGFDSALEDNVVFFGDYSGRTVRASRTRVEVEVPDVGIAEGQQHRVAVKVQVRDGKVSNALELVVLPAREPEPGTGPPTEEEQEAERTSPVPRLPPSAAPSASPAASPSPRSTPSPRGR